MDRSFYKTYFEIEKSHWWFKTRRNIILSLLKKYSDDSKGKTKLLDIGCGSGYLVRQLEELGFESYGLDVWPEAIEFGQKHEVKNLSVIRDDVINFPDNHFDFALALDLLEHLEDEINLIKEIQRTLKPHGLVIITVPAFQFLWGVQDEVSHHYRRYRLPHLVGLIKSSGNFEIIRKTYFNTFLFPPITLARLASQRFKIKNRESDFNINNRFLNKIFHSIFGLEAKFLSYLNFPFGVSCLVVARKKDGK